MERVEGIEPSYAAWEAAVLPLNYTRGGRGLLHGKFGSSLRPGGCGYRRLWDCRSRSSRPWSLGRRHPCRRMVLTRRSYIRLVSPTRLDGPHQHEPTSASIESASLEREFDERAQQRAFIFEERRRRVRMWKVTADRCAGASVAMDGHGRAPTDGSSVPRSTDQPSPARSQWHPFERIAIEVGNASFGPSARGRSRTSRSSSRQTKCRSATCWEWRRSSSGNDSCPAPRSRCASGRWRVQTAD